MGGERACSANRLVQLQVSYKYRSSFTCYNLDRQFNRVFQDNVVIFAQSYLIYLMGIRVIILHCRDFISKLQLCTYLYYYTYRDAHQFLEATDGQMTNANLKLYFLTLIIVLHCIIIICAWTICLIITILNTHFTIYIEPFQTI